jgi:hypothetical protein
MTLLLQPSDGISKVLHRLMTERNEPKFTADRQLRAMEHS